MCCFYLIGKQRRKRGRIDSGQRAQAVAIAAERAHEILVGCVHARDEKQKAGVWVVEMGVQWNWSERIVGEENDVKAQRKYWRKAFIKIENMKEPRRKQIMDGERASEQESKREEHCGG